MMATIFLAIGVEYFDTVFQVIKASAFSQYSMAGIKGLAVLFFVVNLLKKYNEGAIHRLGYTFGLQPDELIKNVVVILLVLSSTQILGFFDAVLVAIEEEYRNTAPALLPIQLQVISIEEDIGALDAVKKAMTLLYEALASPLHGWKLLAFIFSLFLWIMDLFIYPLFLAERFFLLGILQAFFPFVISLSVFEKFRSMAYNFFKLYAAVFMVVPAFFLVNVFVNAIYTEINTNFWVDYFGTEVGNRIFAPVVEVGSIGFIVFLKFKLYRRATSFTIKLFTT